MEALSSNPQQLWDEKMTLSSTSQLLRAESSYDFERKSDGLAKKTPSRDP
jgi:hypothetical protein